jgi:DNA-binding response OmpR family regulator
MNLGTDGHRNGHARLPSGTVQSQLRLNWSPTTRTVGARSVRLVNVLIVESDEALWGEMSRELRQGGHRVSRAATAAETERALAREAFDLLVLDLIVPDCDGLVLLAHIRAEDDVPLIVLSRSQRRSDPVLSFRLGADDVVRYPFVPGELEARAGVLLMRRSATRLKKVASAARAIGELAVDESRGVATLHGRSLDLSPLDVRVLSLLMSDPDGLLTHQQLVERIWGAGEPAVSRRAEREIEGLRRKLRALGPGAPNIQPVRLQAYRLVTDDAERLAS